MTAATTKTTMASAAATSIDNKTLFIKVISTVDGVFYFFFLIIIICKNLIVNVCKDTHIQIHKRKLHHATFLYFSVCSVDGN